MPSTTTVVGGSHTITWNVQNAPGEFAAAQQALNSFLQGLSSSQIVVATDATTQGGIAQVVIHDVIGGGTIAPPTSHNAVILSDDPAATTVVATGTQELIIDNGASNSLTITGTGTIWGSNGSEQIGSGTVIAGSGNDTISVKGDASIFAGNGNDSITVQLGNATITTGTGNDTITLGGQNDTVTAAGTATVHGPGSVNATISGGQLVIHDPTSGGESVTAGSGSATLAGGSNVTFIGGSGSTTMMGGSGHDTFVGGVGASSFDSMVSGGGGNLFAFETGTQPELGTHVIQNFLQGSDFIHLGSGYDPATILANNVTVSGGNTTISLDAGQTKIILNGITNLQSTDFK